MFWLAFISVCLYEILLKTWGQHYRNFQNSESGIRKAGSGKNTSFWVICKFKIWMNSMMLNNQDVGQQEKQMKMWLVWRNLSCKTNVSLYMRLVTFWKVQLAQFMTFWKAVWTCVSLPPNSFPTPARCALSLHEFLAKNKIAAIVQLPSSPDVAPCDLILFQNLKMSLKGRRINDIDILYLIFDITMTEAKPQDTLLGFTEHMSWNALKAGMITGLAV